MSNEFEALENLIWDVEFMSTQEPRKLAMFLRNQAEAIDTAVDEMEQEAWAELDHDYEVER